MLLLGVITVIDVLLRYAGKVAKDSWLWQRCTAGQWSGHHLAATWRYAEQRLLHIAKQVTNTLSTAASFQLQLLYVTVVVTQEGERTAAVSILIQETSTAMLLPLHSHADA